MCIAASAERDGLRLIAVVLGAASGKERFEAATALLDYGFSQYENAELPMPQDAPQSLPVKRGTAENVTLQYDVPQSFLMKKGQQDTLTAELDLPQELAAPVKAGDTVGTVRLQCGGESVGEFPVTAAQDVSALSFGYCFSRLAHSLVLSEGK